MSATETEQSDFAVGVHVEVIGGANAGRRGVIDGGPGRHGPDRTWVVRFANGSSWSTLEGNLQVYAVAADDSGESDGEAYSVASIDAAGTARILAAQSNELLRKNPSEAEEHATVSIALSLAAIAQAFDNPPPRSVPQHYLAGKPGPAPVAEGAEFALQPARGQSLDGDVMDYHARRFWREGVEVSQHEAIRAVADGVPGAATAVSRWLEEMGMPIELLAKLKERW